MISGSAALSAASAAALSPEAIASSTLRTELRMRERRAVLISVRRAITRAALRAEEVLAIVCPSCGVRLGAAAVVIGEKERAAKLSPPVGRLIKARKWAVNAWKSAVRRRPRRPE